MALSRSAFIQGASLAILICLLVPSGQAYPGRFVARNSNDCTAQPALGAFVGPHGVTQNQPVSVDPSLVFSLTAADGSPVSGGLCQGRTYTLTVTFPNNRQFLLTASQGKLGAGSNSCPNRILSAGSSAATVSSTLVAPCDGTGSIEVVITTAAGPGQPHLRNSVTYPIDASCNDVAACSVVAAPVPAPAPSVGGSVDLSSESKATLAAANSAPGCTGEPNAYGYACNRRVDPNLLYSYELSTSSVPPSNPCTQGQTTPLNLPPGTNAWLHGLIATPAAGYVAFAFANYAGRMYPGRAILGGTDDATGAPYVDTYFLTQYALPDAEPAATSWAARKGAARTTGSPAQTLVCFSRAIAVPGSGVAPGRKLLQTTTGPLSIAETLQVNWAYSNGDQISVMHDVTGGFRLSTLSGEIENARDTLKTQITTHGAVMMTVFVGLMPIAILLARHRALMPKKQLLKKDIWFWSHITVNLIAMGLFAWALSIAFINFNGRSIPWAMDQLEAHKDIGIAVIALVGTQLLIGIIRPSPDSRLRGGWNALHHNFGRITVLLALANVGLGIYLFNAKYQEPDDNKTPPYVAWAVAGCAVFGLILLTAIILEVVSARKRAATSPASNSPSPSGNYDGQASLVGPYTSQPVKA